MDEYWQKKPLLVKGAYRPGEIPSFGYKDLTKLAQREDFLSKMIWQDAKKSWHLRYGPFSPKDLKTAPPKNWTLLVSGCDKADPVLGGMLWNLSFVPHWRKDDVMVSYANDLGSVGPHVDNYDVFLVQGAGKRTWLVGGAPLKKDDYLPGLDVMILKDFKHRYRWEVESGDVVYIPPRFGHWGIAHGESLTFSLGFRAPSPKELALGFMDEVAAKLSDRPVPDLAKGRSLSEPGLITKASLEAMRKELKALLDDQESFQSWLGRYLSTGNPKISYLVQNSKIKVFAGGNEICVDAKRLGFLRLLASQGVSSEVKRIAKGDRTLRRLLTILSKDSEI
jgi:50S ribosomal protein L16 3-hydroxylase